MKYKKVIHTLKCDFKNPLVDMHPKKRKLTTHSHPYEYKSLRPEMVMKKFNLILSVI